MTDGRLEEDYAKLAYEVRLYRKQLVILQKEIERITLTALDLTNAMNAVEKLEKADAFIPIGGNSYVKGQIPEGSVLVAVGSGYLVEMEKNVAKEKMKSRVETTKIAVNKMTQEFGKISGKLEAVTSQLKQLERRILIDKRVEEEVSDDYR